MAYREALLDNLEYIKKKKKNIVHFALSYVKRFELSYLDLDFRIERIERTRSSRNIFALDILFLAAMIGSKGDLVESIVAEATTKTVARVRVTGAEVGSGGRGHGCVEKLADYSIVGPVVSVNRHASCRFVVLLSRRSASCTRLDRGLHRGISRKRRALPPPQLSPSPSP